MCVFVCVTRQLSARLKISPIHACVRSPLPELSYKGVAVCIMEINLSALVVS